jgi:hypothetical protein
MKAGEIMVTIDIEGERCFHIRNLVSLTYLRMRVRGVRKWSHVVIFWLVRRVYKEIWY